MPKTNNSIKHPKGAVMDQKDKAESKRIENSLIESVTSFCRQRLDEEYADLCVKLIEKMGRKRIIPFLSGRPEIWAAAVVYAIGSVNFLFDKSFEPYITANELCAHFGAKNSSVTQKAKVIRDMFRLNYFDPDFSTKHSRENNPLKNMVMVNDYIVPRDFLEEETPDDEEQF
jgi:hypothetical protein